MSKDLKESRAGHVDIWGRPFQTEGTASAKPLRPEHAKSSERRSRKG